MTDPIDGGLTCDEVRDLAAAFVLGALDADEMDAVRRHLASCAEPHPEFAELGSVVPVLAASVPAIEPSAALKGRIMAAAAADLEAREALSARVPAPAATVAPSAAGSRAPGLEVAAPAPRPPATPVAVMPRPATSAGTWLMRIAAVLAIVVLGGWNLLLQGQLATAQSYEDAVTAVLDVAGQEGSLTAVLTAEGDGGPTGLAAVSAEGAITLAMRDLPATSGGEVYEAWVIAGDGVPVPLGDFQVDGGGTAFFTGDGLPTANGIVLALTREPGPGATTPTMPIVSLGTATAAS
jgi:anti-sigma-K factor RskA